MAEVAAQIESGQLTLGEITSASDLERILKENRCIREPGDCYGKLLPRVLGRAAEVDRGLHSDLLSTSSE
jgi:hypothetical protein